ncbi:sce7726 family protein [Aliivibrio fischeri]|uniref:Protein cII n=1 Tax=Aliivibrio fischeri TaxID=668 RepID=A0A510UI35_ALIFS|nr:sce7726 family protein [Aliivibrio fischeri]GEK14298.1 hypothetical protein AFI02nite_23340 [Aliivibrio fischeri]
MKEIEIKKILVKYLLELDPKIVLGAEVPFKYGSRRADIMALSGEVATAYEIKGAGDTVDRLGYQVESYKEYFDFCYVVCEEDNLVQVRKSIGREVGIMLVSDSGIVQLRKSKLFKRHDKESLASTLTVKTLKEATNNKNLRSKHDLGLAFIAKSNLEMVRHLSRKELISKYEVVTDLLRRETKHVINSDDILTITRMPPKKLFLRA